MPQSVSEFEAAIRTDLPVHEEMRRKLEGEGFEVRRLHNCPYPRREPYLLSRGIVEIPAAYTRTKSKRFREAAMHLKQIISKQVRRAFESSLTSSSENRLFQARALYEHLYFAPRWYLQNQADVKESRKQGLMSNERVKKIADLIESSLKKE